MYLDILFLYNFIINTLLLYISGYILKLKIRWLRLAGGGAFGALYGVFTVVCNINPFFNGIFKILSAFVMVYIAYKQSLRGYVRLLCVLFLSGFCMCGVYMAFSSFARLEAFGDVLFLNLGYPYIFIVFLVFLFIINLFVEGAVGRIKKRELYKRVEIFHKGRKVTLSGFLDTGNSLCSPEGYPVAFTNIKYIGKLLGKEQLKAIKSQTAEGENIFPLFVSTVNGTGIKVGFMPDKTLIDGKEKKIVIAPVDEDFENNFDILLGGLECLD